MGQYHMVYNKDKKEFIHGYDIDNGLKLMEQVGWKKSTSTALFLLLANSNGRGGGDANKHPMIGRWAGDRVVIQGNYAEPTDQGYITDEELNEYVNISVEVFDMLKEVFDMLKKEFGEN